jgi:glycosyltransferase involved in cell wall biosynthesis
VGALYGDRNAAPVLDALRNLIERGIIDPARVELRLVGAASLDGAVSFERLRVTVAGYVDHAAAVSEMAAADVLLLYSPAKISGPGGKLYEYLVSGRPILCVTGKENFAARLVQELGAGVCADPRDPSSIEDAIETLYRRWQTGDLGVDPGVSREALARFSRVVLARQLAGVLDAAVADNTPPHGGSPPGRV